MPKNFKKKSMNYPDDFDNLFIRNLEAFFELSKPVQVAYCLHQLESELNNGGFHQFFFNSSGMLLMETLQALTYIEAIKTRELLQEAVQIAYPNGFPSDSRLHQTELTDCDDVIDELDSKTKIFYRYQEPLSEMVNKFLSEKC